MSARQSAELDHAFERNGWGAEDVKWLSQGDILASVLEVRRGNATIVPTPLLIPGGTAVLPARKESFSAKEKYVVNISPGSHVKISYVNSEYLQLCGDSVEEPSSETALCAHVLTRPSEFAPAVKELNGKGIITKITPAEQFALMARQPDGPKGASGLLLANGFANLLEVVFPNGATRLVRLRWYGGGWGVYVSPVSISFQWYDGSQVLSRDSRGAVAA